MNNPMMINGGPRVPLDEMIDQETGEIMPAPVPEPVIVTGHELENAIFRAVCQMPVWIKMDEEAEIQMKTGGKFKVKYATLKQILGIVRPILLVEGVRIRQGAARSWLLDEGGGMKGRLMPVYTDLIHSATGQIERTIVEIPLSRLDAQSVGSGLTYGRRYSLLAALGLATDEADDDGAAAKSKEITDEYEESQELWVLKDLITAVKTTDKLMEWGKDGKNVKRINDLSEAEHALLRKHFAEHLRALKEGKTEKPDAKGKKIELTNLDAG